MQYIISRTKKYRTFPRFSWKLLLGQLSDEAIKWGISLVNILLPSTGPLRENPLLVHVPQRSEILLLQTHLRYCVLPEEVRLNVWIFSLLILFWHFSMKQRMWKQDWETLIYLFKAKETRCGSYQATKTDHMTIKAWRAWNPVVVIHVWTSQGFFKCSCDLHLLSQYCNWKGYYWTGFSWSFSFKAA